MRTTLALDDDLIAQAQAFTGLKEKSSLVREALKALIERESARRLARLGGAGRAERAAAPAASHTVILVDTSVWADHLRAGDAALAALLNAGSVLGHPFVVGELALGHLRRRQEVLDLLTNLPRSFVASDAEVLHFIDANAIFGRGVGYIDAHLLAATRLTAGARLWTRDKRLHGVAAALNLAHAPTSPR